MIRFLSQWLLFLLLSGLAGVSALLWGLWSTDSEEGLVGVAANSITVFLGLIVLSQTVLGLVGVLNRWGVLIALGSVLVASWLLLRRAGLAFGPLSSRFTGGLQSAIAFLPKRRGALIVLALVAWLCLSLGISALARPSTFSDALSYHLPMAASWAQAQYLQVTYFPFTEIANSYFPGNGELLYLWVLAPFRNDVLVRLVSLCMWWLLGTAVFRLCRKVGASGEASLVSAALLLCVPVVLAQAPELALDVTSTAFFVLAVGHLFGFARSGNMRSVALFSISSGLFLGVKYSAVAYVWLLLGGLLGVLVGRRRELPRRAVVRSIAISIVGISLLGGYWYIRNLVETGNPVYPIEITLLGNRISRGAFSSAHYDFNRLLSNLCEIPLSNLVEAALLGIGSPFLLVMAISAVLLPGTFKRTKSAEHGSSAGQGQTRVYLMILLLGLIGGSLLLYLYTPFSIVRYSPDEPIAVHNLAVGIRFGMILLALCAAAAAPALSRRSWSLRVSWVILGLAVVHGVISSHRVPVLWHNLFTGNQSVMAIVIVLTVTLVCYVLKLRKLPIGGVMKLLRRRILVLVAVGVLLAGAGLSQVMQYRERFRYGLYGRFYGDAVEGWEWIADNVRGARIALAGSDLSFGSNLSFPVYGPGLENTVRYVNTNSELDNRYHDYGGGSYRAESDYDAWLRNLGEWRAEYLVSCDAIEDRWAAGHPELFREVFENSQIRIYRIEGLPAP